MRRSVFLYLVTLTFLAAPMAGLAQESENKATPWKKATLNIGPFVATMDSSVRLGTSGLGLEASLEDALGLESSIVAFRTDAFWRFTRNKRHRLDFTWFSLSRKGNTSILEDITINGDVIPAGSAVSTILDFDIFEGKYSYSFVQDDRMDLAASVGLYVAPIGLTIESTGLINGIESEDITAPLPVVGLRADFAITPKWFLKTNVDAFYLEMGSYKGSILDFRAAVEYNAFKYVGFGLGFDVLSINIQSKQGTDVPGVDFSGKIDFDYAGLLAYAKFYF